MEIDSRVDIERQVFDFGILAGMVNGHLTVVLVLSQNSVLTSFFVMDVDVNFVLSFNRHRSDRNNRERKNSCAETRRKILPIAHLFCPVFEANLRIHEMVLNKKMLKPNTLGQTSARRLSQIEQTRLYNSHFDNSGLVPKNWMFF
jgi:hypothetical protein